MCKWTTKTTTSTKMFHSIGAYYLDKPERSALVDLNPAWNLRDNNDTIGQPCCVDNQDRHRQIYVRSVCTIPNWNDISSHVYCNYKLELTFHSVDLPWPVGEERVRARERSLGTSSHWSFEPDRATKQREREAGVLPTHSLASRCVARAHGRS